MPPPTPLPTGPPPSPDRRFVRLIVDLPTFSDAVVAEFAPGADGASVEYRVDPELGSIDPVQSGVRLATGALLTLEADKLSDAAMAFVPDELQAWVRVGAVLIETTSDPNDPDAEEPEELPEHLTSNDPGPWVVELWMWPGAGGLSSLGERVDAVRATPRMGLYTEWLTSDDGQRVLAAIVEEATADQVASVVVALADLSYLWGILPPDRLAEWLGVRDAAVAAAVVEATGAITSPVGDGTYGADLRRALEARS